MIRARYSIYILIGAYLTLYSVLVWESLANRALSMLLTVLGFVLVGFSMAGRLWAIRTLGPFHSIHVEIRENHRLIQSGPYTYIRNPYYVSVILEAMGLPLLVNSFTGALIAVFVYLPVLFLRIFLEEMALEKKFKESFSDYKNHVPRIIPKVV